VTAAHVTELPLRLAAVEPDPFIEVLPPSAADRSAASDCWPHYRSRQAPTPVTTRLGSSNHGTRPASATS
jgi:hypothetical protein